MWSRANATTSSAASAWPGRGCTAAWTRSPQSSSGTPKTATSSMAGWRCRTSSISAGDVDAARDDHVALPVADVNEAFVVHPRDVTHARPLAALRFPCRRAVLVVAVEHPGEAAHVELARRARGHRPARVVEQHELDARRRAPARARLPQHVRGREDRVDAELGRAVELPERRPEDRDRLLIHARRARRGGADEHAHRR